MTYLERFMTFQKGYMGQQEGVYDLSAGVRYFKGGIWGNKRLFMIYLDGLWHLKNGYWGDRQVFMIYLEGFMALQKEHMGQQEAVYDSSRGVNGTSKGN